MPPSLVCGVCVAKRGAEATRAAGLRLKVAYKGEQHCGRHK